MVQYRTVDRDLAQYVAPGSLNARDQQLLTQFLFQYRVNPQTAVFVGYSGGHTGTDLLALERNARSLFLKFSYGWKP